MPAFLHFQGQSKKKAVKLQKSVRGWAVQMSLIVTTSPHFTKSLKFKVNGRPAVAARPGGMVTAPPDRVEFRSATVSLNSTCKPRPALM